MILFSTALKSIASTPPATQVAPIRPPKSACDELEGSPRNHVTRFHKMAPTSPAKITTGLMSVSSTSPPEMVLATWTDREGPGHVQAGGDRHGGPRPERARRDGRGHGVGRVVEPVGEVEDERGHDDDDDDQRCVHGPRPFERPTGALQVVRAFTDVSVAGCRSSPRGGSL